MSHIPPPVSPAAQSGRLTFEDVLRGLRPEICPRTMRDLYVRVNWLYSSCQLGGCPMNLVGFLRPFRTLFLSYAEPATLWLANFQRPFRPRCIPEVEFLCGLCVLRIPSHLPFIAPTGQARCLSHYREFQASRPCDATIAADKNPNGIPSVSPGLRGTSYPGDAITLPTNPNGGVAILSAVAATPLGL